MNKIWLNFLASLVLPAADRMLEQNAIPAEHVAEFRKHRNAIADMVKKSASGADDAGGAAALPDLGGFFKVLGDRLFLPAREANAGVDEAVERAIALRQSRGEIFPAAQHTELCNAALERGKKEGAQEAETRLKDAHAKEVALLKRNETRRTLCASANLPAPTDAVLGLEDAAFDTARSEASKRVTALEASSVKRDGEFARRYVWCSADERAVLDEALKPAKGAGGDPLATGGSGAGGGNPAATDATDGSRAARYF